jgi:hypothetical protein
MSKNFTLDSFKQELQEFYNKSDETREFVVMTGLKGRQLFDDTMRRVAAETIADGLKAENKINEEEYTSLVKMINSPDMENLIVAMAVMEQKGKYEQRRISTTEAILPTS